MRVERFVIGPGGEVGVLNEKLQGATHVQTHLRDAGRTSYNGQPDVIVYAFYPDELTEEEEPPWLPQL